MGNPTAIGGSVLTTPRDNSVTTSKIVDEAVTAAKIGSQPCCRVSGAVNDDDGNTAMDNGEVEVVRWTTEKFDNDSMFTAPNDEIIINKAGKYYASCVLGWNGNPNGRRIIYLSKNGSTEVYVQDETNTQDDSNFHVGMLIDCDVDDTLSIRCFQDSGTALDILSAACDFSVMRVSP